jgi:vesicle coat complex subunit
VTNKFKNVCKSNLNPTTIDPLLNVLDKPHPLVQRHANLSILSVFALNFIAFLPLKHIGAVELIFENV